MNKDILNKDEKKEISLDVKNAFDRAKKNNGLLIKKINKSHIIISIIIIIVVFLAGLYFFFNNNPRDIFIKGINSTYAVTVNNIKLPNYKIGKGNIIYNDMNISYVRDYENGALRAEIGGNDIYIKDSKMYLKQNDEYVLIADDIYYLTSNPDDIMKIFSIYKNEFIKLVRNQKFDVIKDSNEYQVSLEINDNIKRSLMDALLDNKKLIALYKKLGMDDGKANDSIFQTINKLNGTIKFGTTSFSHDIVRLEINNVTFTKLNSKEYRVYSDNYKGTIKFSDGKEYKSDDGLMYFKIYEQKGNTFEKIDVSGAKKVDYNINDLFQ